MWNQYFEPTVIEERRSLRAPDAAQLILTAFLLIGSALILKYFSGCTTQGTNWIYWIFFGSIFWLVFIMTSLVGQYKSRALRFFFKMLDYAFFLFLLAMWIWALVLVNRGQIQNGAVCNDATNWFNKMFIWIGWFLLGVLAIGLLAGLCASLRPKENITSSLGGDQILSNNNYGNDTKFNPYEAA